MFVKTLLWEMKKFKCKWWKKRGSNGGEQGNSSWGCRTLREVKPQYCFAVVTQRTDHHWTWQHKGLTWKMKLDKITNNVTQYVYKACFTKRSSFLTRWYRAGPWVHLQAFLHWLAVKPYASCSSSALLKFEIITCEGSLISQKSSTDMLIFLKTSKCEVIPQNNLWLLAM